MNFEIKLFHDLALEELYELLKLRVDVFVVEQKCAYEELDNHDQKAIHVLLKENNTLVGYARILFEGKELHIGRIITHQSIRGKGWGKRIMNKALTHCKQTYRDEPVYLSAQAHLETYYRQFGFHTISAVYDWDGINHIDMVLHRDKENK